MEDATPKTITEDSAAPCDLCGVRRIHALTCPRAQEVEVCDAAVAGALSELTAQVERIADALTVLALCRDVRDLSKEEGDAVHSARFNLEYALRRKEG